MMEDEALPETIRQTKELVRLHPSDNERKQPLTLSLGGAVLCQSVEVTLIKVHACTITALCAPACFV